jgi:hypothetical protein
VETHTVITVTMSPEDLSEMIISAVRAGLRETSPAPEKGGKRNKKMLSPKDIEDEYGITSRLLMYWRQMGMGPAYTNFGKRVFYDRATFEKFVAAGQVQTTGFIDR